MRKFFIETYLLLRPRWRQFALLNLIFYGIFLVVVVVAREDPALQDHAITGLSGTRTSSLLAPILDAYYGSRNVLFALVLTFSINVVAGSLLMVTLPSLVVPFLGLLVAWFRAYSWGTVYSLGFLIDSPAAIVVPLLEGQGYVLASFAAYEQGVRFLRPGAFGLANRAQGFVAGLKITARIYVLVALVLFLAGAVEVYVSGTVFRFPAVTEPLHLEQPGDVAVALDHSHAVVYRDSTGVSAEYALAAGTVLEDIAYLRPGNTPPVRVSREGDTTLIRIQLEPGCSSDPAALKRFRYCIGELSRVYPARAFRIIAVSRGTGGSFDEKGIPG